MDVFCSMCASLPLFSYNKNVNTQHQRKTIGEYRTLLNYYLHNMLRGIITPDVVNHLLMQSNKRCAQNEFVF